MTPAEKQFLGKMLDELEDLRANQVALNRLSGPRVSYADAQDAKSLAKQEIRKEYASLREELEGLA